MIKIGNRSLIGHGDSLFISIPKIFASHNGLEKKSKISMVWNESKNELIVRPVAENIVTENC